MFYVLSIYSIDISFLQSITYLTLYIIHFIHIGCNFFLPNAFITRSFKCTTIQSSSIEVVIRVSYDHLSYTSDDMFQIPTLNPSRVTSAQSLSSGVNRKHNSTYLDHYSSSTSKTNWYTICQV